MVAPLVKRQNGFNWVDISGFPVGAVAQTNYQSKTLPLTSNTAIILASDGIVEAMNTTGEMFSFERLQQSVGAISPAASSQQILDHIWLGVKDFIQDAEPHDDMTLMVVQTG